MSTNAGKRQIGLDKQLVIAFNIIIVLHHHPAKLTGNLPENNAHPSWVNVMKKYFALNRLALSAAFVFTAPLLSGAASGESPQPGVNEVAFAQPVNFVRGERLLLNVGGSASQVQVYMGDAAVGGMVDVPASRTVEVLLPEDKNGVSQLYVHGNGPASIVQLERIIP